MKCNFIDSRNDFFTTLGQKLGPDFQLEAVSAEDHEQLIRCEVIVVGVPCPEEPDFAACLARLQQVARNPASVPVVAFLSTDDCQGAYTVTTAGAYDHWVEASGIEELRIILRRAAQFCQMNRELQRRRNSAFQTGHFADFVCADAKMRAIFSFASKVAATDATVLITGETGTGKELLARGIHQASARAGQPYVAVACSSLPETLIEAELFGHERGAFTGATGARRGRFEAAERGTIFLDEIGELSPAMQVKLLRVLQERIFERLGSNQARSMEARVICATNRDLGALVRCGEFRADLYYRLNTIELKLPPLRERRGDIVLLAHTFLHAYAERHNRPAPRISPAAMSALQEYDWPGNVRELQNVMERAVVICDAPEITLDHLPSHFAAWQMDAECQVTFDDEVRSFKRRLIQRVLCDHGNNKLRAARSLGIARSSLHRLIDELDVSLPAGKRLDLRRAAAP